MAGGIFTALSTAWGVYSSFRDQQMQNELLDYQSDVGKYNAQISQYQADDARERGIIQERLEVMKAAAAAGEHETTEVGGGEGGTVIGVGSRYDAVEDIAINGKMMGDLAKRNAEMEAWGHERQAEMSLYNAKVARSQKKSTFDMVATSVFGNAEGIGKTWDAFKTQPTTIATGTVQNSSLPISQQGPINSATFRTQSLDNISSFDPFKSLPGRR
jgi:hypothetical protein